MHHAVGKIVRSYVLAPGACALALLVPPPAARADLQSQFDFRNDMAEISVAGFVPDVPLLLAPSGRFLVVPEQSRDGFTAKISIIRMDPDTGRPYEVNCSRPVAGFAAGYPPRFIVDDEAGAVLAVPFQGAPGVESGVLLLTINATGYRVRERKVMLGDLRFIERMRGGLAYSDSMFFAEDEAGTSRALVFVGGARGPRDGWVTVIGSTPHRIGDTEIVVSWLENPRAPGVEPTLANHDLLIYPTGTGDDTDVLFILGFENPTLSHAESLKARNLDARPRPMFTGFPGNVAIGNHGLIPVNGPGDTGDILSVDGTGRIDWSLSWDAERQGLAIPSFPDDVRFELFSDSWSHIPVQVQVPIRSTDRAPADLWSVNLHDGRVVARVDDWNPGLPPFRFALADATLGFLAPIHLADGSSGLFLFRSDMTLDAAFIDPSVLGFRMYVPPIGDYIPVTGPKGDSDFLFFNGPHLTAAYSLKSLNPDLVLNGYERGVDPVLVGEGDYVFMAEEDPVRDWARLRVIQNLTTRPQFAAPSPGADDKPGSIAFLDASDPDRTLTYQLTDVWGLVPGVPLVVTPEVPVPQIDE